MKKFPWRSNPYWQVGILHNDGLDFVIKHLYPKEQVTIEKVIELVSEYLQSIKNANTKYDLAVYYEFIATTINGLNQISFQEFLKEAKVTKEGVCFINDIQNVSPDFDYPTILKVLSNIEFNIFNTDMTDQEKQLSLLSIAVAKSSVEYWIRQMNDPKSNWLPFIGNIQEFRWPWRADASGAVSGAIGGAIGGAVGGPGGAVIGGILGGIGGGIGASVAEALFPPIADV